MTVCNMSIEAGARAGMIAPDETTFDYLRGRPVRPAGLRRRRGPLEASCRATPARSTTASLIFQAADIAPQVTWGTNPGQVAPVDGRVPDPGRLRRRRPSARRPPAPWSTWACKPGTPITRDRARPRVHRLLHQRPDRRPAGRGGRGPRPSRGRPRQRDGRARQRPGEAAGRSRRARPHLHARPASNGARRAAACAWR